MDLMELQMVMGNLVKKINDPDLGQDERERVLANADMTSKLAKQMINNADICLRYAQTISDTNRNSGRIKELIG